MRDDIDAEVIADAPYADAVRYFGQEQKSSEQHG